MKIILSFFLLLFANYNIGFAQDKAPVGEDWRISEDDANDMIARLNVCDLLHVCRNNSKVIDLNNEEYQWIVSQYSGIAKISLVDARYRSEDQDRYKRLRGITDTDKYKVKTYKTKLVKVELYSSGFLAGASSTLYYDCFSICPPPNDGSCGSGTVSAGR